MAVVNFVHICLLGIGNNSEIDEIQQENDNIFLSFLCDGVRCHPEAQNDVIYRFLIIRLHKIIWSIGTRTKVMTVTDLGKFDFKRKPRPNLLNPSL